MIANVTDITSDMLLNVVDEMKSGDYRFVTATCVDLADGTLDVIYHFDKELELKNFRMNVKKNEKIHSITNIYFCALLVENEMKEQFGLNITDIVIDYGGHMILTDEELKNPMLKQIMIEEKGDE